MLGIGLFQATLMLIAAALFAGIIIGGMYAIGPKKFWWEYFKPVAATPIAWGTLHLVLALIMPNVFHEMWTTHWHWLATVEISVFMLNTIVNKDVPFTKRVSRFLLATTFVMILFASMISIGLRIFAGEFTTNLDRAALYQVFTSKVQHALAKAEEGNKKGKVKKYMERLAELDKIRNPTDENLEEIRKIKIEVEKIFAVPEDQKINWEESFSKISLIIEPKKDILKPSVMYLLPPGKIVNLDTDGNQNPYKKGDRAQIHRIQGKGIYSVIPTHGNPFEIRRKNYQTGPAATDGITRLMANGNNDESLLVQVTIISPR